MSEVIQRTALPVVASCRYKFGRGQSTLDRLDHTLGSAFSRSRYLTPVEVTTVELLLRLRTWDVASDLRRLRLPDEWPAGADAEIKVESQPVVYDPLS